MISRGAEIQDVTLNPPTHPYIVAYTAGKIATKQSITLYGQKLGYFLEMSPSLLRTFRFLEMANLAAHMNRFVRILCSGQASFDAAF